MGMAKLSDEGGEMGAWNMARTRTVCVLSVMMSNNSGDIKIFQDLNDCSGHDGFRWFSQHTLEPFWLRARERMNTLVRAPHLPIQMDLFLYIVWETAQYKCRGNILQGDLLRIFLEPKHLRT